MNKAKIEACEKLCKESLERAKTLKANEEGMKYVHFWGCRESGALRRISLDLTMALADLRRAG